MMLTYRQRFARWLLSHRRLSFAAFGLVTLGFAAGLPGVKLQTIFSDLLPTDDPFVQVYKDHPDFGSPLTVLMMIRNKDGDIYNPQTLQKIWDLTANLDKAPAVDHEQVLSITTEKARYAEATPFGIDMRPLMGDHPPRTDAEIAAFRKHVDNAPNVRQFLISRDGKSALVMAVFIEQRLEFGELFDYLQKLAADTRDAQHEVFIAGQPPLIGWVYHYEWQMIGIFLVTLVVLIGALAFYMRNVVGVLTPIITSAVAGIWAFGLVGWLDISIEPLLMVIPLLLTARSFSHSVQFTERFYEVYAHTGDRVKAAEITMAVMMAPSILGIMTDVLGIIVVVAAPIPAMVRHAIFCGAWAIWLIPTGCVLISLLLATLPAPRNVQRLVGREEDGIHRRFDRGLMRLSHLSRRPLAPLTSLAVVVLAVFAVWTASQIKIGNPVEGTSLLWRDSFYNTSVRAINRSFPGINTLEIIFESKTPDSQEWTSVGIDTVESMSKLQRLMESSDAPPRTTLSFVDYLQQSNRLFHGGDPRWLPLDPREKALNAAAVGAMMGSSAKAFSNVVDSTMQNTTVSLWYPDNKQTTVDAALAAARKAVDEIGIDHPDFRVRLGSGTIALQQAVNNVVERYEYIVVLTVNLFVFALASFAFRSLLAGAILIVPVNLSHQVMTAAMHLLGVGLDVNSMIVSAVGIGIGIDYGIYLLSRISEEVRASGDWEAAITAALRTTGKAILFTGTIMASGIMPWYLLSGLRFVADMGLLLIVIMAINMVLALIVLPLLVWWIKPAFALREDGIAGESNALLRADDLP